MTNAGNQGVAFVVDLTERKRARGRARRTRTGSRPWANSPPPSPTKSTNRIAALLTNAGTAAALARRVSRQIWKRPASRSTASSATASGPPILSAGFVISQKAPARKESLEINEAILEIIGLARAAMSEHGVSVQTQLADGLPRISGDRVQLQQVILNLIMNAIEAMSEVDRGTARVADQHQLIRVGRRARRGKRFGPGLPQANPERIFDAFYTTKPSGLGMGLSICRSIVEAHGGRLWATPNEPRGAVFCVMLPIGEGQLKSGYVRNN